MLPTSRRSSDANLSLEFARVEICRAVAENGRAQRPPSPSVAVVYGEPTKTSLMLQIVFVSDESTSENTRSWLTPARYVPFAEPAECVPECTQNVVLVVYLITGRVCDWYLRPCQ